MIKNISKIPPQMTVSLIGRVLKAMNFFKK